MSDEEILDLDALTGSAGRVRYKGKVYEILPLDAGGYKQLKRMREGGPDAPNPYELMTELARRCVPTLAEQVDKMTLPQISGIVTKAGSHLRGVEKHPKSLRRPSGAKPPRRRA